MSLKPQTLEYLKTLAAGSRVAILILKGSLNPMTHGHVDMLIEGRRVLLDYSTSHPEESFDAVIAIATLNSDNWVLKKLLSHQHYLALPCSKRAELGSISTEEHPWITVLPPREFSHLDLEPVTLPHINAVRYYINGADDVLKYRKWQDVNDNYRIVCIGRPGGYTEEVNRQAKAHIEQLKLNSDESQIEDTEVFYRRNFLMGNEMADISSTAARNLALKGDRKKLRKLLHATVADFMIDHCRSCNTKVSKDASNLEEIEDQNSRCCDTSCCGWLRDKMHSFVSSCTADSP